MSSITAPADLSSWPCDVLTDWSYFSKPRNRAYTAANFELKTSPEHTENSSSRCNPTRGTCCTGQQPLELGLRAWYALLLWQCGHMSSGSWTSLDSGSDGAQGPICLTRKQSFRMQIDDWRQSSISIHSCTVLSNVRLVWQS